MKKAILTITAITLVASLAACGEKRIELLPSDELYAQGENGYWNKHGCRNGNINTEGKTNPNCSLVEPPLTKNKEIFYKKYQERKTAIDSGNFYD